MTANIYPVTYQLLPPLVQHSSVTRSINHFVANDNPDMRPAKETSNSSKPDSNVGYSPNVVFVLRSNLDGSL